MGYEYGESNVTEKILAAAFALAIFGVLVAASFIDVQNKSKKSKQLTEEQLAERNKSLENKRQRLAKERERQKLLKERKRNKLAKERAAKEKQRLAAQMAKHEADLIEQKNKQKQERLDAIRSRFQYVWLIQESTGNPIMRSEVVHPVEISKNRGQEYILWKNKKEGTHFIQKGSSLVFLSSKKTKMNSMDFETDALKGVKGEVEIKEDFNF